MSMSKFARTAMKVWRIWGSSVPCVVSNMVGGCKLQTTISRTVIFKHTISDNKILLSGLTINQILQWNMSCRRHGWGPWFITRLVMHLSETPFAGRIPSLQPYDNVVSTTQAWVVRKVSPLHFPTLDFLCFTRYSVLIYSPCSGFQKKYFFSFKIPIKKI